MRVISVQEYAEPKQTREFMIEIAEMFGASRNLAERDFDNVMSFHRRLTQVSNTFFRNDVFKINLDYEFYN